MISRTLFEVICLRTTHPVTLGQVGLKLLPKLCTMILSAEMLPDKIYIPPSDIVPNFRFFYILTKSKDCILHVYIYIYINDSLFENHYMVIILKACNFYCVFLAYVIRLTRVLLTMLCTINFIITIYIYIYIIYI